MADPICRWRNSTPKTVCELVSQLPKAQMSSSDFRLRMCESKYGRDFFTTPYQLACQLGLYVEDNGVYIPRFQRDITEQEAKAYLMHWFRNYYVPNPYTKRGFQNMNNSVIILDAFINYLTEHNLTANFNVISESVFGEPINNIDILVNCFRNYSKVISIDKDLTTHLSPDYKKILVQSNMDRIDKKAFFQQFLIEDSNNCTLPNNLPLQVIYYGAPGTGKSFEIDSLTNDDNSVRTTFHPDSDYASFVGAYKPTMEDVPISAIVGKEVHAAVPQGNHTGKEKKIVYKYVPQAFLKAYVAAWSDLSTPQYLVIEEINRGNCAQIFGDLFQLLDRNNSGASSYPIHADEDIKQFLKVDKKGFAGLSEEQRQGIADYILAKDNGDERHIGQQILDGELLLLPPNLHIWATMNTSDQSLFPIDSAFKRRWDWKYIPISYVPKNKKTGKEIKWKFNVGENLYSWGEFLSKINPEIYTLTESSDKQMGYFFAKANPSSGIISEDVFLNKVLFYLWTEVLKDYTTGQEIFINPETKKTFVFTDFFDEKQNALENFIANLKLEEVEDYEPEDSALSRQSYKSMKVEFPDGVLIQEPTIEATYLKALEAIGIDKAAEVAETSKYKRHEQPLISKDQKQILLDNNYTYAQIGDYQVVTWLKTITFAKILREISDKYNLGLNVILGK